MHKVYIRFVCLMWRSFNVWNVASAEAAAYVWAQEHASVDRQV